MGKELIWEKLIRNSYRVHLLVVEFKTAQSRGPKVSVWRRNFEAIIKSDRNGISPDESRFPIEKGGWLEGAR